MVMFVGNTPTFTPGYALPEKGFGAQDQFEFGRHLAQELERNEVFSSVLFNEPNGNGYIIHLDFERTVQYQDMSKYDFYLNLSISNGANIEFEKKYVIKGKYGMKEYFTGTTTRAGKVREANKLMSLLVNDIQGWVNN
jgi:hypothetical protein